MYFSEQFRRKKDGDFLILSFRVSEKKVEEHRVLIGDGTLNDPIGDTWCGSAVFKIKKCDTGVLLKFHTNECRADIYCLTSADFRMLQSLYLSIRGI